MKAKSNSGRLSKGRGVRFCRSGNWIQLMASGAFLFGMGGCLGPNPGFFISSSVANASIFTVVNSFLSGALGLGGG
jgi:hypothetical protein